MTIFFYKGFYNNNIMTILKDIQCNKKCRRMYGFWACLRWSSDRRAGRSLLGENVYSTFLIYSSCEQSAHMAVIIVLQNLSFPQRCTIHCICSVSFQVLGIIEGYNIITCEASFITMIVYFWPLTK